MQVEIELATEDDKSEAWDMYVPAMKSHIDKIWGWEVEWQTNEFNSRFLELNTSFLVLDSNRIGYVQYSINEEDTYLNMVVLKPAYQGKSLGIAVLDAIQNLQLVKPLRLRCFHVNERALKFYINNGFRTIESEENFVLLERNT